MGRTDLALIGYEPPGSENLALRILAAEVERAGFGVTLVPISALEDSPEAIGAAVRARPLAIGLSLLDSVSAIRTLPLAGLARKRGFDGFIVCGGPFATLQTTWVLDKAPAVGGVVRHAGEGPLVDLLVALKKDADPSRVPGLVTRSTPTTTVASSLAQTTSWRPLRGDRPKMVGIPTAEIISSVGCKERCEYCTHAAVASLALREYRDAGVSRAELDASGLGKTVRRPLADLVDEMAELYRDQGVRYFQVIDENPVPEREDDALKWISEFRRSLDDQGIGPIALSLMTRGDNLTEKTIDALVDLGMVRTLIGIESGTASGLESLGRAGKSESGLRALTRLDERGVVAMFNSLMIHPSSSLDTIRAELAFLQKVPFGLFETVEAAPFAGTRLNRRMRDEQRLFGGTLLPMFDSEDNPLERFRVLRSRLRAEALGSYTPTFRAHDLLLSAIVLRRVGGRAAAGRIEDRSRAVVREINRGRLDILTELVDAAEQGLPADDILKRAAVTFGSQTRLLAELGEELTDMVGENAVLARHCRNFAAAASLVFALANAPACSSDPASGKADAGDMAPDAAGAGDADTDGDSDMDGDTDPGWDTDTDTVLPDGGCADWLDEQRLERLVSENCRLEEGGAQVKISIDDEGVVESVDVVTEPEYPPEERPDWIDEIIECYEELLEDEKFPCLSGEDVEMWIRDWGTPL